MENNLIITETDISYVPSPNLMEIMRGRIEAPLSQTPTAFSFPVDRVTGKFVLAHHIGEEAHRGISIPGGHVDPNETLVEAAIREVEEETGFIMKGWPNPIGYQKTTSEARMPENYNYPFPVTYQQFYVGVSVRLGKVTAEECGSPVVLSPYHAILSLNRKRDRVMCYLAILEARLRQWTEISEEDMYSIERLWNMDDDRFAKFSKELWAEEGIKSQADLLAFVHS